MKYSNCFNLNQSFCTFKSSIVLMSCLIRSFYCRRNTGQTREKIDQIYLTLQDWSSCLTAVPKGSTASESFPSFRVSLPDVEGFMHRLRCLFEKSSYHEQILLLQVAPIEWGWKKICNFFHCTSHQARAAILQRRQFGDFSKPVDRRGNKQCDPNVAQIIQDYYLDDEISRQSSNTKDTRKPKGAGTVVIRYMTMSIGETFELFKTKYPNIKVSRSKFYSLHPTWVREDSPHEVCMCIHHQNVDLILSVRE